MFLTSSRLTVSSASTDSILASLPSTSLHAHNTQLPSPISPMTQPSPTLTPYISSHSLHLLELPLTRGSSDQTPRCDVAPMKGFVHEVLRCSRTSGSALQTVLCYLKAIRSVPMALTSTDLALPQKHQQAMVYWTPSASISSHSRSSSFSVGFDADKVSLHKPDQM